MQIQFLQYNNSGQQLVAPHYTKTGPDSSINIK